MTHDVEGYLLKDLRDMQPTSVRVGYPLLMATFAGIELFGGLLSSSTFNTHAGQSYFADYWTEHLYPNKADGDEVARTLYQLVRHGIAHVFMLKGPIGVIRGDGSRHLRRDPEKNVVLVDAVQLSADFIKSYESRVKAWVFADGQEPLCVSMAKRLNEMFRDYRAQAEERKATLDALPPIEQVVEAEMSITASLVRT